MKNYWLTKEIVGNGPYWTFEIYDEHKNSVVPETSVDLTDTPCLHVTESLEVDVDGEKVWTPVCIVWEKLCVGYTDQKFINDHHMIRLLEVNGQAAGIMRRYDIDGEHIESWVLHGLRLTDIDTTNATFVFHHAIFLTE